MRLAFLALAALPFSSPPAATDAGAGDLEARIRAIVEQAIETEPVGALAVAILLDERVVFTGAWGLAVDHEAVFRAGALGDALIATAVLQLVDEGKLDLEARVADLLPELRVEEPLRLRHLLIHASGLPDLEDVAPRAGDARESGAILARLAELSFEADPGTCVRPTATNSFLLGRILERVDGRSVPEALRTRVFLRAGMTSTGYRDDGPPLVESAAPRLEDRGALVPRAASHAFDEARLCSTVEDLARWQGALDDLIGARNAGLCSREALLDDGSPSGRVIGFEAVALGDVAGRSAGGALAGGRAHVASYVGVDLSVAILCDAPDASVDRLERRLARLVLGLPAPEIVDEPLSERERARFVGSYYVGCTEYRVREDGERLVVDPPESAPFALLFQGGLRFVSASDPDVEVEFREVGGAIVGWWLSERGARSEGRRM